MESWSYSLSSWPAVQPQSRNDGNKRTGRNNKHSKFSSSGERSPWSTTGGEAIYEYKDPGKQFYNIVLK